MYSELAVPQGAPLLHATLQCKGGGGGEEIISGIYNTTYICV